MNDCEQNTQRNDSEAEAERGFMSSIIFAELIKKRRSGADLITSRKPLHKEQNLGPKGLSSLVVKGRTRINS